MTRGVATGAGRGSVIGIALAVLSMAAGCDEAARVEPSATRAAGEPEILTLAAEDRDHALAAFLAPLSAAPGAPEAESWHQERVKAAVDPDGRLSILSLRVYRLDDREAALPLGDLALTIRRRDAGASPASLSAVELPPPRGDRAAERAVVASRSLAAFRASGLRGGDGFEAWVAFEGRIEISDLQSATLVIAGRTLELIPREMSVERFAAFAAEPRREWIVAAARVPASRDDRAPTHARETRESDAKDSDSAPGSKPDSQPDSRKQPAGENR